MKNVSEITRGQVTHKVTTETCPSCKEEVELHKMETEDYTIILCVTCKTFIRLAENTPEGIPALNRMYVSYMNPSNRLQEGGVFCIRCNAPCEIDHDEGEGICLEPTCGRRNTLGVPPGKVSKMQKERKALLKQIAEDIYSTKSYAPEDKARLEELTAELKRYGE